MKYNYHISGMTCNACVAAVEKSLSAVSGINHVEVDLAKSEALILSDEPITLDKLKRVLPSKYAIIEDAKLSQETDENTEKSKLAQLKPLLLIFLYLFAAVLLMHHKSWDTKEAMLDFMGLFYVVFSFFKLLDYKGFPGSFRMYDPLAKVVPLYGWVYPFIELGLGLLFLFRYQVFLALLLTLLVLGITTVGVTKTLLDKKKIRCACLGTALQLPMTEATFIENAIMLVMAITMLTTSSL